MFYTILLFIRELTSQLKECINKVVPIKCAGLARYDIPEKQQS